jgi:hypothetical protein
MQQQASKGNLNASEMNLQVGGKQRKQKCQRKQFSKSNFKAAHDGKGSTKSTKIAQCNKSQRNLFKLSRSSEKNKAA